MKGIVIYQSNYGSTEQYARWIGEETGFAVVEMKKMKKNQIADADTIVIGAPIFAGKPQNFKWIMKNWPLFSGRKTALFTTSGAPGNDPLLRRNFETFFPEEIRRELAYFPLGGRMKFSELSGMHRFFMNLGRKMEKDPAIKEEMIRDKDHVDRESLRDLIGYLK